MKQAILILWHRNESNLMRLIDHFDEGFDIYVHVDRKREIPVWLSLKSTRTQRVKVISDVRVRWGGLSIVKAELALIRAALSGGDYSYLHIISGEDVALASPEEFRSKLSGSDRQYIEHHELPTPKWNGGGLDRIRLYWPMDLPFVSSLLTHGHLQQLAGMQRKVGVWREWPEEFGKPYGGSNWVSLTQGCARWLVTAPEPRRILKRLRHTFAPDEIFFQTAVLNSPYAGSVVNDSLRFIDWGKGKASPEPLSALHARAAMSSGALFARKSVEGVSEGFVAEVNRLSKERCGGRDGERWYTATPETTEIYMIRVYEDGYNGVDTYGLLLKEIFGDRDRFKLTDLVFSAPKATVKAVRGIRRVMLDMPPKEGLPYLAGLGILTPSSRAVFIQNFCPASPTVCTVRTLFPGTRILYVVHDFMWMAMFNGDVAAYREFIENGILPKKLAPQAKLLQALFLDTRNAAKTSDAVVCHNSDTEELLHDFFGISREHIRMIPMGLPQSRHAKRLSWSGKTFLFAGRPTPQKGFDTLMEAAAMLETQDPEARIVVAGNPMLYKGKVPKNVIFRGNLSREDLISTMGEMAFGVNPSRYEQFGLAGLEMMREGLPVISSDSFGVRCMFNTQNSLIFHTGDSRGLFERMKEALGMTEEERRRMSEAGERDFAERFSFAGMKEKYIDLVDGLFADENDKDLKEKNIGHDSRSIADTLP